jgi:mannitol/fructose-specific phosphotransferase system IIA component (Ntr-type)
VASLREYLDPACVAVDVRAADKEEAIRALVRIADSAAAVKDPELLIHDILERERLAPTGLGESCAVPHAHSDGIADTRLVFARLAAPIDFGAPDDKDARLVVLMAGPRDSAGLHLKLLSKLARMLHDAEFRAAALAAPDAGKLARLIFARDG